MTTRRKPPPNTRRAGEKWHKTATRFKDRCRRRKEPCWICLPDGPPIDYDAEPGAHLGFELDHAQSVRDRPDLMWVESNYRASHLTCNRSRGARAPKPQPPPPPEFGRWVKPDNWPCHPADIAAAERLWAERRRRGLR